MNFKKIISVLVALLIISASFMTTTVSAAGTNLQFSNHNVEIGNKFVVTIKFNPSNSMLAVKANVTYNPDVLKLETSEFVIGDGFVNATNAAGVVPIVFSSLTPKSEFSIRLSFTTLATGSSNIAVKDCVYTYQPAANQPSSEQSFDGESSVMNVIDKQLSDNANLSALTLSSGNISEKITTTRTKYTASVPFETDKITFYTKTSDTKATVTGVTPNSPLNVGANTFKITVTAQNGSQKIYTVVITRREQGAEETPVDPTPDNPLETVISGKNYEIVTTIPEASYLQDFTLSSADWNGSQVPVLRDEDNVYTVYYLKEAGATEIAPYIYNDQLKTFEALKHQTFNGKLYIFEDFPNDMAMPGDYYSTYSQIGNYSVKVYLDSNSQMSDFSYVYCYANGNFGLYRYDSKENTIQRFPDIHLVDSPKNDAPAKDNFVNRFTSLSTNGKILLIAMLVAAICVVALIVFLIISIIRKLSNKDVGYIEDDFDFDDVTIVNEEEASQLIE